MNPSLDIWSFGVIMYEFLVGIPPFNDETPERIFQNILSLEITWPKIGKRELLAVISLGYDEDAITPEAKDLMDKLLDPDYENRIKIDAIKKHAFFSCLKRTTDIDII